MAGTTLGARIRAAKRIGIELDEYVRRVHQGQKWCVNCKDWHPLTEFGRDASRTDGLASACSRSRRDRDRARYVPKLGPRLVGRRFVEAREGDALQARRRVNYLVDVGLLADPDALPCVDCRHEHGDTSRRHEYDHYLGYAAEHHEDVEAVCSRCHHAREVKRRES